MLKRAISCFEMQTYVNRQLIILYEDNDIETTDFIDNEALSKDIKAIKINGYPKKTLGELRNVAIAQADGDYICQWDDDDWYCVDRLTSQYNAIIAASSHGSVLTKWLLFDSNTEKAYISNSRNWEGSIMCKKATVMLKGYQQAARGEDTGLIEFLFENGYLTAIDNKFHTYIYVYHGRNTWNYDHFSQIFKCSHELPLQSRLIKEILEGKYAQSEASFLLREMLSDHLKDMINNKQSLQ